MLKKHSKKCLKKCQQEPNKKTSLSKEREERKIIRTVEACNLKLENRCEKKTRKKGSKSRNIGQMIVFETPNGSNPPTRSLTGPKHVKLHKMLQKAPRPCQNPPKIVPKPFPNPPQTLPKSFKNRTRWRVRTVRGFETLFGRQNGPPNLAKTLQNEAKIRRKSMKNRV